MIHERNPRHFRAKHFNRTRETDMRAFKKHGLTVAPRISQKNQSTTLFLSDGGMHNVPPYSDSIYTVGELRGMARSLANTAARIESVRDRLAQPTPTNIIPLKSLPLHHPFLPSQN